MSDNSFGQALRMTSFGESHGKAVGVVIEGLPAGLVVDQEKIQIWLDRRRPGQSKLSSNRKESDIINLLSGVYKDRTTGAPLTVVVQNEDVMPEFYNDIEAGWARPGHADYPAFVKYGGYNDPRGGGRFSARITVGFVIAGAISYSLIKESLGIDVVAYVKRIGAVEARGLNFEEALNRYDYSMRCPQAEANERMEQEVSSAKKDGDSVGGIIECLTTPVQPGLGQPVFSSLDSELAKGLFSIPAVKAVEFGAGFQASGWRGSRNNDIYEIRKDAIRTRTNNSGGIIGGLTIGEPLVIRVGFKPTSSIYLPQQTVNFKEMKEGTLSLKGRHDPCVVPRAVPIVESIVSFTLADMAIRGGMIRQVLRKDR